jgi:hypothetical protein
MLPASATASANMEVAQLDAPADPIRPLHFDTRLDRFPIGLNQKAV